MDLIPGNTRIVIHPPIDTTGYSQNDIPSLIAETRTVIKSALG